MGAALSIEAITARFGGITALNGLSLDVAPGEALGLLGPNGSGKSTLVNVLSGHVAATGRVRLDGRDVTGQPPHCLARLGVTRTFQTLRVFWRQTVLDNLRTACPGAELDVLALVGLDDNAHALPTRLTPAQLRRLELARVIASDARLVLLDEPTAGMTPPETDAIARLIADHILPGRTTLLIEHKPAFVASLCPRIAVLDQGGMIADAPARDVLADPTVRRSYFGEL